MVKTLFLKAIVLLSLLLGGCLTSKKMDAYIASQFNNELPKPPKRSDSSVTINSTIHSDLNIISVTEKKSKSVLPLILYWSYDYRHICTLNPAIGINHFRKAVYQQSNKLKQKLNGRQLELTVEQIPGSFAIVDKGAIVLIFIHWDRVYVEPSPKDLIVSYNVSQNGNKIKSGKIIVPNIEKNRDVRFAQSWRSSASEFITQYSIDIAEMEKLVINQLLEEL